MSTKVKLQVQDEFNLDNIESNNKNTKTVDYTDGENVSDDDIALDSGYSWAVLAGCFMMMFTVFGINYTTGIFLNAYRIHFKNTISTSTLTFIATVGNFSTCIALILSGRFAEKFGFRTTILVGAVLKGLAYVLASFFTEFWHLLLTHGILSGISTALLYPVAVTAPAQWFHKRQGFAIGVAVTGSGIGGFVFAPALEKSIQDIGLVWTLRLVGIISIVVLIAVAFIIKERKRQDPKDVHWLNFKMFKNKLFLILLIGNVFLSFSDLIPQYLLQIFAVDMQIPPDQGAFLISLLNIGTVVGKLAIGYLADKLGKANTLNVSTLTLSVFTFTIWTWSKTFLPTAIYSFLYGVGYGGFVASMPALLAQTFGLKELTSIIGFILFGSGIPALVGIPIGLKILELSTWEKTKDYLPLILYTATFNLAGGIMFMVFRYIVNPRLFIKL